MFTRFSKKRYSNGALGKLDDEVYKIVRNNILVFMNEGGKSFMVTSPSHIHQKSLITAKIALSFAELGKMTLLVDLNVNEPSFHRLFSLDNKYGLTSLLLEEDLEEHSPIHKTVYDDLYVLAAGSAVPLSKSIIWDRLEDLMREWEEFYDFIIFELPPYIGVSDTQILTEKGDGVLLVMQEGKTKKKEALETKKLLERGRKKFIGAIYCS
nr:CpsD/CapB family tyrosine-protein kinase [Neobacillus sp. Marseille-Q6967]